MFAVCNICKWAACYSAAVSVLINSPYLLVKGALQEVPSSLAHIGRASVKQAVIYLLWDAFLPAPESRNAFNVRTCRWVLAGWLMM